MLKSFILKLGTFILSKFRYTLFNFYEEIKKEQVIKKNNSYISKFSVSGNEIKINGKIYFSNPQRASIGNNVHIGDNAYIQAKGGLSIGDHTHISRNVAIYTINHNYQDDLLPYNFENTYKPVIIGKNVWIGMNVNILPGVSIGEGSIIGMGTVVSQDIPKYTIKGVNKNGIRDVLKYENISNKKQYGAVNGKIFNNALGKKGLLNLNNGPIFIIGTGRSGTTSLSKILSKNKKIDIRHESRSELISLSTAYEHHKIGKEELLEKLKIIYFDVSGIEQHVEVYGESDQKFANLIPFLNELFPNSKFIWAIRNPIDTVNSTYSRGWFDDEEFNYNSSNTIHKKKNYIQTNIFTKNRINGAQAGVFSNDKWLKMSAFEKNCWYWSYWNNLIHKNLEGIPDCRKLKITLKELNSNISILTDFINFEDYQFSPLISNKAKKKHALITQKEWSEIEFTHFKKWCSPNKNSWYKY